MRPFRAAASVTAHASNVACTALLDGGGAACLGLAHGARRDAELPRLLAVHVVDAQGGTRIAHRAVLPFLHA